jgi:hypothetical protein
MRRKYSLTILFLILAIFLTGCAGGVIVTPANDEAAIRSVINEYFLAINDQNWSKAKSYCINGSDEYYRVSVIEDGVNMVVQYYGKITIVCFPSISNVLVEGNYASAYIEVTIVITAGYYSESDSTSGYFYLQKIGNSWKLY